MPVFVLLFRDRFFFILAGRRSRTGITGPEAEKGATKSGVWNAVHAVRPHRPIIHGWIRKVLVEAAAPALHRGGFRLTNV
jgi:hypothetical protein